MSTPKAKTDPSDLTDDNKAHAKDGLAYTGADQPLVDAPKALPEGFTKGNLQYAITRLWKDEVEKIEGKVNTYRRKA